MRNTTYKLLVLDLDGTLTNSQKELSERNKAVLIEVQKQGVKVILASGRPTYGIVPLAEELELAKYGGYILSFNGGAIIDCSTQETLFSQVLPDELLPRLYEHACENEFAILSYNNDIVVTEHPDDKYVAYESFLTKMEVRGVESFLESVSRPVPKCLIVGDADRLALLEQKMIAELGNQMNIYRSESFFLELVPLNIDKAESLARLLAHVGMEREEMIAIGDGYNDLSMIQFAGMGVAMENAKPEVKEAADYITTSNDEDGVADVVEKFILI